jgi:hypothetical protein
VAIPVNQVHDQGGKLIMAGATPDTIKAMPAFSYASDEARQAQFVAAADRDLAQARDKLTALQKNAAVATAEAKLKFDAQSAALARDLQAAEAKLAELRRAGAKSWHAFEADLSAAMAKLRKTIDAAMA